MFSVQGNSLVHGVLVVIIALWCLWITAMHWFVSILHCSSHCLCKLPLYNQVHLAWKVCWFPSQTIAITHLDNNYLAWLSENLTTEKIISSTQSSSIFNWVFIKLISTTTVIIFFYNCFYTCIQPSNLHSGAINVVIVRPSDIPVTLVMQIRRAAFIPDFRIL